MSDLSAMVAAAAAMVLMDSVLVHCSRRTVEQWVSAVSKRLICLESLSQVGDQRTNELWVKGTEFVQRSAHSGLLQCLGIVALLRYQCEFLSVLEV